MAHLYLQLVGGAPSDLRLLLIVRIFDGLVQQFLNDLRRLMESDDACRKSDEKQWARISDAPPDAIFKLLPVGCCRSVFVLYKASGPSIRAAHSHFFAEL